MQPDLEILSATICAHAREQAGKEWETEHRPILMQILANVGLAKEVSVSMQTQNYREVLDSISTQTHNYRAEGTLTLDDREVPTEVIVKALHEHFLAKRTSVLIQTISDQVVRTATRKAIDDEDAEKDQT
jgi:flagellar motor component MotA